MLLAIRHARTSFNEDGHEKLRGWLPIPLSAEGLRESHQAAAFLQQLKLPLQSLQSSPITRAMQTATIIGQALRMPVQQADQLKDWNVGALTGRSVMDTLPTVQRYVQKPDLVPAQGESYATFRQRAQPFLEQLIAQPDLHAVVTHNRVMTLLKAMAEKDDALLLKRGPVEPGGIALIRQDGQVHVLFKGKEEADEQKQPVLGTN